MQRDVTRAIPAATLSLFVATAALTGCGSGIGPFGTQSESRSHQVNTPVNAVVIRNEAGRVQVTGTDDKGISVEEKLRFRGERPKTSSGTEGGRLVPTGTCPGKPCDVDYVVRMPHSTSVEIEGQAGTVRLENLSGTVSVQIQAGTVTGSGLSGRQTKVTSQAGTIELAFTAPPRTVDARTEAGSVTVRLPGDQRYAVDATTQVGAVTIEVVRDPASPYRVSARARTGSVRIVKG